MTTPNVGPATCPAPAPAGEPSISPGVPALLPGLNIVVICPNLALRDTLIRVIQETSKTAQRPGGIEPVQRSDSESAQRAHYAPAITQVIINTASERMHDLLGRHVVAVAVVVDDRAAAAQRAKEMFDAAGFSADVYTQAEPEFPDKFLTFVSVEELQGIVLMFWPDRAAVPADLLAKLPQRKPWSFGQTA